MRKYIDTSNLIVHQSGRYKGTYDWESNIGKELYFEYDDISGYIKILDYKKTDPQNLITLQYQDQIKTTSTPNLLHLKIPSLFHKEKQSKEYVYNVGDIISKFDDTLKIIKQTYIMYEKSSYRGYEIECLDCHYKYTTREDKISTCPICGKKTSYAERFVHSFLMQANIPFKPQKEFDWLKTRYYDIFIPEHNAIIEINGLQHYEPTKLNSILTPQEIYQKTLEADKIKYNAAISHNLSYYIINACNPNTLFSEVKNTLTFIDSSPISELECEKFANYKKIRDVCNLWNQGHGINDISKTYNVSQQTISSKLRLGNKYNMCIYNKNENMHFHKIINPNKKVS